MISHLALSFLDIKNLSASITLLEDLKRSEDRANREGWINQEEVDRLMADIESN